MSFILLFQQCAVKVKKVTPLVRVLYKSITFVMFSIDVSVVRRYFRQCVKSTIAICTGTGKDQNKHGCEANTDKHCSSAIFNYM